MPNLILLVCLLSASSVGAPRWGHEPYPAASPLDVAVSPVDGTIYIAETAGDRVVVLGPDFRPTGAEFAAPAVCGVDVAADGRLALRCGPEDGVTLIAPDRQEFRRFAVPTTPAPDVPAGGVAFDAAGNVFVFDPGGGRVLVYDADGAPLFEFGEYTWTRRYHSAKQNKPVEEPVPDRLYRPVRGDFLPDGRMIIADYDGPVIDPENNRRSGKFSVWKVDVTAKKAVFEKFAKPDEQFADFKAGDVCVEDRTGRIFYAEADFPLTDHDFVSVADSVDEPPRFTTNYFPIRFLTHPRGVAVGRGGDVIVAEADKGVVFAMPRRLFDTPKGDTNPLEWPKVMRVPVCERERVVIEYSTFEPAPSRVEFAPAGEWYDYPNPPAAEGRRGVETAAFDAAGRELPKDQPGVLHRVELTGLQPGQRYAYRWFVTDRAYPGPLWSETFLATTQPPPKKTQYLDAEVIVLLFTNLVEQPRDPNIKPEPADPGPLSAEEIDAVKVKLELARRFYWINSRAHFNLRYRLVLEPQRIDPAPVVSWGYWPNDDHRRIDEILARHGVAHADTAGLFVIYGYRHWDPGQKKWLLSGSGGNTWGSCHDGSGITTINAGGDTCWLFVHEYGHSMSINYGYCGHSYHFNHFHWNWLPTRYGSHYDGNAAMAREMSDVAYWSNKYGRLRVVDDADEDGLPDLDPACALDEERFGSDPTKRDTDGDGLSDLEELMATQGLAHYAGAFDLRQIEPVFEPAPTNPDTDGDGVRDGDDRYPLYPWSPDVYAADITIDGRFAPDEWPARGFRRLMTDAECTGDVRLAWNERYLWLGLAQQATNGRTQPDNLYVELDLNNDGMTVGADNVTLRVNPRPDGTCDVTTNFNDTIIRQKPTWRDNILPNPRDVPARWSRVGDEFVLEIGIPQTKDAGLDLVRWEDFGFLLELRQPGRPGGLRLVEPQQLVELRLR